MSIPSKIAEGQCWVVKKYDQNGLKRVEITDADDWIRISIPLLQSLDPEYSEFTDDGVLKIRAANREVHYKVGMSVNDLGYYVGKKVFDSEVAE